MKADINSEQTQKTFEKNMRILPPWLRDRVLQINESELQNRIDITFSEKKLPICRYRQGNRCFQITGEHPVQEAQVWAETHPFNQANAVFVYGCGFGYPLAEIMVRKDPQAFVLVFEQDVFLFRAMLYFFDLEPFARTNQIAFLVGDCDCFANAFENLFYTTKCFGCTFPAEVFTYAAQRNFKEDYLKIHQYVFEQLSLLVFHIGNDHLDNLIGLRNMLKNTKEILQSPGLGCLKDVYRGFPAFIIANGPSLDRNIRDLKNIRGKGLILSVESAIKPLLKNGIQPDILTVIERTKGTYTCHFQGMHYPKDLALICLALVDPHVFPSFHGEKIPVFRKAEAVNAWISGHLSKESSLDAGANVSHLALEIAAYLGADPIIFVGQDYAFGANGMTHSKDSVYYEERGKKTRDIIHSRPVVYVEGNDGTMIPSYQLWVDFRHGLERKIAAHTDRTFLNATEGGAKIKGTVCMPLNRAIEQYCTRPLPKRVHEQIAANRKKTQLQDLQKRLDAFLESILQYIDSFRKLAREATEKRLACGQMLHLYEQGGYEENKKQMEKICQEHLENLQDFIRDFLHRSFCQQILFANYYFINRIGNVSSKETTQNMLYAQYRFFDQLHIVCQSTSVYLEDAAATIKKLQHDLLGKAGIC